MDFTQVKNDVETSKPEVSCTKSLVKPKSASSMGISLAASLASFVDSGLQWKAEKTTNSTSSTSSTNEDPLARSSSAPKRDTSTREGTSRDGSSKSEPNDVLEDQESLLQRDLAMVLDNWEEITQRKGENKEKTKLENRQKSVIKGTGSFPPLPATVSNPPLKSLSPSVSNPLLKSLPPSVSNSPLKSLSPSVSIPSMKSLPPSVSNSSLKSLPVSGLNPSLKSLSS